MSPLPQPKWKLLLAGMLTVLAMLAGCQDSASPPSPPPALPAPPAATPGITPAPAASTAPESQPPVTANAAPLPGFVELVKTQGPAVVNISTFSKKKVSSPFPGLPGATPDEPFFDFFKRFGPGGRSPGDYRTQSLGSGFIIDESGYILTNAHVVEDAEEVTVTLTDKRNFKAKVVGSDMRTDVALLKISATDLPIVMVGDPAKLEVGEWVVAIGAPFGFSNSVTQGIVSAKGRDLPGEGIVPFIQSDVAVNPGNSGGPLFNMRGEVVGINSQIYSRSGGSMGISFSIPIDVAMRVKDQLQKHGMVRRGRLGVMTQNVSQELAESFKLPKPGGALIAALVKGGPADRAGIRVGDIILEFEGKEVSSSADLARAVADAAPGMKAHLNIWRDGTAGEKVVSLGEAEKDRNESPPTPAKTAPDQLGLNLRELSQADRRTYHIEGTIVVEAAEGLAAAAGIQPGDIILSVNNRAVSSIEQLRAELAKSEKRAALLIQRGADTRIFISLELAAK